MTIPFGSRRLVIALVTVPDRMREPAEAGASDQELARLVRPRDVDDRLGQLAATALIYRVGLN
jgi:hypothetical protein